MTTAEAASFVIKDIALSAIDVWRNINVRSDEVTADIDGLAHSLKTIGLQQPIVVQKEAGRYKILVGQRRFLAAKRLEWPTIAARVVEGLDEGDALLRSLSENIHRRDLTPNDKSKACKYLLDRHGTTAAVAAIIGYSEATVRKWLGYYYIVPDAIKQMVEDKHISSSVAMRIAENVKDENKAIAIAEQMPSGRAKGVKAERDRFLAALEENPERPLPLIRQRAEQLRKQNRITFVLPPQWEEPLAVASRELKKEEGDIAKDALIDWLRASRYQGIGAI